MGAWIEMFSVGDTITLIDVAPSMGAWIEILSPSSANTIPIVAPSMGAWIEIPFSYPLDTGHCRRSLYGSVD